MTKILYPLTWLIVTFLIVVMPLPSLQASTTLDRIRGRILIQVEQHGEAWYVYPVNDRRYFLGRPNDAFSVMRQLGLGISENDFAKLNNSSKKYLSGRILIRVQKSGQAYYVNPTDLSLHFLGRPNDAFSVMRQLGLGISDKEINKLALGFLSQPKNTTTSSTLSSLQNPSALMGQMEKNIHTLINAERTKNKLNPLSWNDKLAAVAREHSQDQADENQYLISTIRLCNYSFIHHEGQKFGIYQGERLNQRGVYNFSSSGENIALIPQVKSQTYNSTYVEDQDCQGELTKANDAYTQKIKQASGTIEKINVLKSEIKKRSELLEDSPIISILDTTYYSTGEINQRTVTGWMNSPGHRRNILNSEYDEAGIGVTQVKEYFIITQVFIKRIDCGYKNGACCVESQGYYCYEPNSCNDNNLCTPVSSN